MAAAVKIDICLRPNLTKKQHKVLSSRSEFLLLEGVAGTGKTYTGIAKGMQWLRSGIVTSMVIVRSAVSVRDIGFLPGDQDEKQNVYCAPYVDLFSSLSPKLGFKALEAKKLVKFTLTSFLRGVTFEHAVIIVDEYQNMSAHELETILTRVGEGTRVILCGDSNQSDHTFARDASDHIKIINVLKSMSNVEVVSFGVEDIVRSGFVKAYYEAKEGLNTKSVRTPLPYHKPQPSTVPHDEESAFSFGV